MSFQPKDLKILWGKAAGRCSFDTCRKKLVADASDAVPSKAILLGENCHIVAEKDKGPRGRSDLSSEERNRYPNLILLCANHHKKIDQDPNNWSIERIHQIKADHEIWVETQLTVPETETEEAKYYSSMVNIITESLQLSRWDWVVDNAFRCILVEVFVDGVNNFCEIYNRAVWPQGYDSLRSSIKNLYGHANEYVDHFMTLAIYKESNPAHFREDKLWKRNRQDNYNYDELAKKSRDWQKISIQLLSNLVVALNEYAVEVRALINPSYLIYQGKFTIEDTMGMSTDGFTPTYYIPEEYVKIGS